ncbi:MAG: DUF1186 family protein [Muribaculaceae bacterium]|nr:DUF1186 family protein [Muribaculaceae bacterium]
MGVKDAFYTMRGDKSSLEYFLTKGFVEIPYEEAHNIIYGAISFAEDAGIEPHKNFEIGQYILEEDTEDIPLIDYEFGRDGKYFLVVGQDYKERVYINTLKERLGDNFEFLLPIDDDEYDLDDEYDEYDDDDVVANAANKAMLNTIIDRMNNRERTPDEEYSYKHPSYPSTLTVRHQFIADAFSDKNNFYRLPDDIIAKIHALPVEEAISDIYNIVMYEIGRTYKAIDDGTINDEENGSIVHSLIMLSMLKSPDGLEAVLEIMRQNSEFADYHLGDLAPEIIPQALYACCKDYIQPMLAYMYASGFESYLRSNCLDALGMIAINNPERRPEVIEILRQLLISMVDRLPKLEACDGTFAGFVMSLLVDLKAKELIPEIKKVYETDCVDDGVTGDFDDIIKCLEGKEEFRDTDRYEIQTPEEIYKRIENFN